MARVRLSRLATVGWNAANDSSRQASQTDEREPQPKGIPWLIGGQYRYRPAASGAKGHGLESAETYGLIKTMSHGLGSDEGLLRHRRRKARPRANRQPLNPRLVSCDFGHG
jgi:hypothetical protein